MPMRSINHEHEQLVSLLNQLMDERDLLARENEYLKAKLNESILVETVNEMKKERDLLLKLLTNLTNKYQQEKYVNDVETYDEYSISLLETSIQLWHVKTTRQRLITVMFTD